MKKLKGGGRVVKAQATTTSRTQITAEQQLRHHTALDVAFGELSARNNDPRRLLPFDKVSEFFVWNWDEMCYVACDGVVKVVASAEKKKTEKNSDDCRDSITAGRFGNAAGDQGAYFFLAKGKSLNEWKKISDVEKHFHAPPHSEVIMTPNAYMTDEVWAAIVPKMCKSIRDNEIVKQYPHWWVLLSLDGFTSHIHTKGMQDIFVQHKILIFKEEGDSSHIIQPYDQQVARRDKIEVRKICDQMRPVFGKTFSQWHLIAIAIEAQNKVPKEVWVQSFIRVNMHPKFRVSFKDWLDQLKERGVLSSAKFFKE